MALRYANRVKETSTTTGTSTLNLGGASTGFQTFVAGIGTTNKSYYVVTDNTDWEAGIGTVTSGSPDTLARDTVLASSNGGAKVNWGSGTKDVFSMFPGEAIGSLMKDVESVAGATTVEAGANGTLFLGDATSAAFTITLPAGADVLTGFTIYVKKTDASANAVTIDGAGAETIDGVATLVLSEEDKIEAVTWNGTEWSRLTPTLGTVAAKNTGTAAGEVPTNADLSATADLQGKKALSIPASGMIARITNGPSSGSTETTTNKIMARTWDYDDTTVERAQFTIVMPKSWNEGAITVRFVWTATPATGDVVWGMRAVAISDDDPLDAAFGAAVEIVDSVTAADDLMHSGETSAMIIGGTPAESDFVVFEPYRSGANGLDTLVGDARLLGVQLFITTDAGNDA